MIQQSDSKTKKNMKDTYSSSSTSSVPKLSKKARRLVANLRPLQEAPRRSSRSGRFTGSYSENVHPDTVSPRVPPDKDVAVSPSTPMDDIKSSPSPFRPPPSPELYTFEKVMTH